MYYIYNIKNYSSGFFVHADKRRRSANCRGRSRARKNVKVQKSKSPIGLLNLSTLSIRVKNAVAGVRAGTGPAPTLFLQFL